KHRPPPPRLRHWPQAIPVVVHKNIGFAGPSAPPHGRDTADHLRPARSLLSLVEERPPAIDAPDVRTRRNRNCKPSAPLLKAGDWRWQGRRGALGRMETAPMLTRCRHRNSLARK